MFVKSDQGLHCLFRDILDTLEQRPVTDRVVLLAGLDLYWSHMPKDIFFSRHGAYIVNSPYLDPAYLNSHLF